MRNGVIFIIIGVPGEVKEYEYRIALTPSAVPTFMRTGNPVLMESVVVIESGINYETIQYSERCYHL